MSAGALFLTGTTGFVGRHVLAALAPGGREVRALVRGAAAGLPRPNVRTVVGDVTRPETYAADLAGCELVLHLAAVTGRASEEEHQRVNAEGTERLLEAARAASVRRFLHVSTIAARYPDEPHYPYARAKERSERAVAASGLAHVVVRPTIVLGRDAPAWRNVDALARLPLAPLPGGGRARIQPIDVDDLARGLVLLLDDESLDGQCLEFGGPEPLSFADLLRRAHGARHGRPGRDGRAVPVPVRPVIAALAAWERLGLTLPPVTAGQLSAFVHDSDARPNALQARLAPSMLGVDAMLAKYVAAADDLAPETLAAECERFCRYLGADPPTAYVMEKYARACELRGHRSDGLDRRLLEHARRGGRATRVADVSARFLAPTSELRRRLVLLLAILESTPAAEHGLDRIEPTPRSQVVRGLVPEALRSALCLALGLVRFGPQRLSGGRRGPAGPVERAEPGR